MSSAALYCRISRDAEGEAVGVANQEAAARELAAQHGLEVAAVYVDNDVSASTNSRKPRPQFDAMLEAAERGEFSTIIAYSMSRLTRRPAEWERLIELGQKRGVQFIYRVSPRYDLNTADGRATARTVAAWDAAEAERTSERRRFRNASNVAKGIPAGRPRVYGFEPDGMTPREEEAAAIHAAYAAVIEGTPVREIARQWNAGGSRTTRDGEWSAVTVRNTLLRERNAGILIANGERQSESQITPIVDLGTYERAVAILTDKRRERRGRPAGDRWLSGIALCACGEPLVVGASWSRGTYSPAYVCRLIAQASRTPGAKTPPGHGRIKADIAEAQVATVALLSVLDRHADGSLVLSQDGRIADARARIEALEGRLARVTAAYLDGAGDLALLRSESASLKEALEAAQADHAALVAADTMAEAVAAVGAVVDAQGWLIEDIEAALGGWAAWWHEQTTVHRQRLVRALWREVQLMPADDLLGRFEFDGVRESLDVIDWRALRPEQEENR